MPTSGLLATCHTAAVERATGIGGVFFRAEDPDALTRWYAEHLGIDAPPPTYEMDDWWQQAGPTVWAPFPAGSEELGPPGQSWMINFRVSDIDRMVAQLRAAGIDVDQDPEFHPNGRFAALADPEANPIQLWEPARRAAGVHIEGVDAVDVFFRHVERFNAGVVSGRFDAMAEQFTDDAVMVFEGGPGMTLRSRAEIVAAYSSNPPDDPIIVLAEPSVADLAVAAPYGWRMNAGACAGHMRMTVNGEQITHLVVTVD